MLWLSKELITDNGEFISSKSYGLIENLGVDLENHQSWRPDLKGMIEQNFHQMNLNLLPKLP